MLHEINAFSMSAEHVGVDYTQVVQRHTFDTNAEQALFSCDAISKVLVK